MTEYIMVIEVEADGTFSASFPDLPGCYTQGDTLDELHGNAQDAVTTYLAALSEKGLPIPEPRHRVGTVMASPPDASTG